MLKGRVRRHLKRAAITAGFEAVAQLNLGRLWPAAAGRGLIFTLHNVTPAVPEPFAPNALLAVTPAFLAATIERCRAHRLVPVPVHRLPALLADPADQRTFVSFTLDDGYRDNLDFAAPVFTRFDVPFTVFITKGFVERTRTMWWRTVEEIIRTRRAFEFDFGDGPEPVQSASMAQKFAAFDRFTSSIATGSEDDVVARIDRLASHSGIDPVALVDRLTMDRTDLQTLARNPLALFGAHTVSHVNLKRVGSERLRSEIAASSDAVADVVGRRPQAFCYPYGGKAAAGGREFAAVAEAEFAVGVTTQPGVIDRASIANTAALPRVSLNGLYQKPRYVDAMISGIPFRMI